MLTRLSASKLALIVVALLAFHGRAQAQPAVQVGIDGNTTQKGNMGGNRFLMPSGGYVFRPVNGAQGILDKIEITLQVKTAGVWGDVAATTNQAVTNANGTWTSGMYGGLAANTDYRLRMKVFYQENLGAGFVPKTFETFTSSTQIP